LQLLLLFVPLAAAAAWLHWSPILAFAFAGLAIVPLAGQIGDRTEELAARLGAGPGGLLNASFGNAAELIIALVALQNGLQDVVKASLTGSIIGNVLLVLGAAMLAGGVGRERQRFDRAAASAGATLLALAATGLLVPAIFDRVAGSHVAHHTLTPDRMHDLEHRLSLMISGVLFVAYLLSLMFTLRTHRHLYAGRGGASHHAVATGSPARPILLLLLATGVLAWMSELLVAAVEPAAHALGLSRIFIGVIVVAVVGNAAEHSTAIRVAINDQMDLAMNIAVSSSTQIALFVAPVLVFVSLLMPGGPMDLIFSIFEVLAVTIAVVVVSLIALDGESNWLEGALMLAVYVILGIAFFFLP
jgi:Ca2+:H+ antiporter